MLALVKAVDGLPFWIWDKEEHRQRHAESNGRCCFNHAIPVGEPVKNGVKMPLFDYEQEVFDALESHRYIWVKKSRGLGITEFMLRYIAWKCLAKSKLWSDKNACIITGPRIDTAIMLIRRLKKLFPNIIFEDKETVCALYKTRVEAFPSHNLGSMRGLTDVCFILSDESDFYPVGQQQDMRAVVEGYIAKSDPQIALVSTPNRPEGLFEEIEKETDCMYHRIFLPYRMGLGKIYTVEEIAEAMQSPSFEREYNLAYIGEVGDVVTVQSIENAIRLNAELMKPKNKEFFPNGPQELQDVPVYSTDYLNTDVFKSLGVDAGFGGSSKFGLCVTQLLNIGMLAKYNVNIDHPIIQVLTAQEFDRPSFDEMIYKITDMIQTWGIDVVYVDSANPEIVRAIKKGIGERTDFESQISRLKQRFPKGFNWTTWMKVIPVSFREEGRSMLAHTQRLMDGGHLAIDPSHSKLHIALRTAVATDGLLDKTRTSHHDILDAFRLSLKAYSVD